MVYLRALISGILVIDLIATCLPKIADPSEVVHCPRGIEIQLGGHALNVSQNLAKLGNNRDEILVIGAIGKDIFGEYIKKQMLNLGIRIDFQEVDTLTSKDIILVVEGEDRRYHVDIGANIYLNDKIIEEKIKNSKPSLFYLGGSGMLGELDHKITNLLELTRKMGITNFLDIVTPYKKSWDFIVPSLKFVDIFHCNDTEARKITKENNLINAIKKFNDFGVKYTIITMGKEGLIANLNDDNVISQESFKVNVLDPTGAGDAFCSGIINELLQMKNIEISKITIEEWKKVLMHASAVAAACLTGIGTTSGVKTSFIQKIINNQGDTILKSSKIIKFEKK